MEKYCLLDTPVFDKGIKNNILTFQQTYVSASQKKPWFEWSIRALRIKLLCGLIRSVIGKRLNLEDASQSYYSAAQMARFLETMNGEEVKLIRSKLMEFISTHLPYRKYLKGKPIHRLFWQAVNEDNLTAILDSIKT